MTKLIAYYQTKIKKSSFFLFFITSFLSSLLRAESNLQQKEKVQSPYAPGVESILASHQYLQTNNSPLYWRISPYYLPQLTDSSCSLASATMIVNAARSHQQRMPTQPLASQDALLERVKNKQWLESVKQGGEGVSLLRFKGYLEQALQAYGVKQYRVSSEQMHPKNKNNEQQFRQLLTRSESTGKLFLIANFNQKFFTDNESVGHFSPIGAYDKARDRVLIMDPDRKMYEPYWVPLKLLLKSMSTPDQESGHYRGYLVIEIGET